MSADVLGRIRLLLPTLSTAEARVGEWVLARPRVAAQRTLAQVAEAAGVSEPTVVRFCWSLDLSGFRELRLRLLVALQQPDSFLHQDVSEHDDGATAVGKVLDTSARALIDLRAAAQGMPFEQATAAMCRARQLLFMGLGASGLVARDAEHKFFRLGIPCTAVTDPQTIQQHAALDGEDTVYLAVSASGTWRELVDAMALAAQNGALVIAVTDPTAPLAAVVQINFAVHPVEDTNLFTPMSSRLVQLALLDALQVALALELGDDVRASLRRSKEALQALRG